MAKTESPIRRDEVKIPKALSSVASLPSLNSQS